MQRFAGTGVTDSRTHVAHQLTELLCWHIGGAGFNLIGCNTSSVTSLQVVILAGAAHAGTQQAQAAQHCTRYDSNALDRRALHYLLSSATLR